MAPMSLPPGFRFHPTDEELVAYYLERKITGRSIELDIIPEVDLYKCEPWDLPEKSFLPSKDMEWYFYSPRDRKYPNGSRTNRATKAGYWKATGKDKEVQSQKYPVGMKKTLVYYKGRAPRGVRTNWVMHEYRLAQTVRGTTSSLKDSYSLCRIFKKTIQISKPENEKQAKNDYKKSMWVSSEEQVFRDEDSSGNEICRKTENADEKEVNHEHPNSSSDLTQGTPTAENNIAIPQAQYAYDEANSTADNPYSLTMEYASNLFRDTEPPIYESLKCQFQYPPPLEPQDFPKINCSEPKPVKQEMPMDECMSPWDKYRDFMNGTLEEIISLCSSQHNPIVFPLIDYTDLNDTKIYSIN